MNIVKDLRRSLFIAVAFVIITFPIMVIRVNTVEKVIEWRWERMFVVGVGSFFLSFVWRYMIKKKEVGKKKAESENVVETPLIQKVLREPKIYIPTAVVLTLFVVAFPFVFSLYQTNIMITALIYVVIALGLNIVVGLAGLLDLGYVAFYAVGAYSYALLNFHFGVGFWIALPIGAGLGALFGIYRCHAKGKRIIFPGQTGIQIDIHAVVDGLFGRS